MVNIVAGIIIDTFGDLRDKEQEKKKDIEEKCFICGIEKYSYIFKNKEREKKYIYIYN